MRKNQPSIKRLKNVLCINSLIIKCLIVKHRFGVAPDGAEIIILVNYLIVYSWGIEIFKKTWKNYKKS